MRTYLVDPNKATRGYCNVASRPAEEESRQGACDRGASGGIKVELESFRLSESGVSPCGAKDPDVEEERP